MKIHKHLMVCLRVIIILWVQVEVFKVQIQEYLEDRCLIVNMVVKEAFSWKIRFHQEWKLVNLLVLLVQHKEDREVQVLLVMDILLAHTKVVLVDLWKQLIIVEQEWVVSPEVAAAVVEWQED